MKKILLTFTLLFVVQFGFAQQQDEAFKKDVIKLIEISGGASGMKVAKDQIVKMIPQEKQVDFSKDFDALLPSFYDKMAKVYMEVYTKEDVKGLLAFYETPVGKKICSKSEELTLKSMTEGQQWATEIMQDLVSKYLK